MPIYKILEEMPYEELKGWGEYFGKYPVGWREDRRAYIISCSMGAKLDIATTFPTLQAVEKAQRSSETLLSKSLKASPWMHLLASSQGGDKIEGINDAQN